MSSPYPPSAPKKLYRSRSKRMIAGVCGGLADYLNMDPTLVRILTVVISLFTGVPVVLYIVAIILLAVAALPVPSRGFNLAILGAAFALLAYAWPVVSA